MGKERLCIKLDAEEEERLMEKQDLEVEEKKVQREACAKAQEEKALIKQQSNKYQELNNANSHEDSFKLMQEQKEQHPKMIKQKKQLIQKINGLQLTLKDAVSVAKQLQSYINTIQNE